MFNNFNRNFKVFFAKKETAVYLQLVPAPFRPMHFFTLKVQFHS